MAFLQGLNGKATTTAQPNVQGSSRFLGGLKKRTAEEQKISGLRAKEEKARAESARLNDPKSLAMETVKGIPKVLWGVGKALVDDPMKTLATPVVRAEQAAVAGIGRLTGNKELEEKAYKPLDFPSMLGGSAGTIEPQRGFDDGGAKQIAGDTAKYAATIYTGGKVPPVAGKAFLGQVTRAGLQGAKEGAIGAGGYMAGDEAQRKESTFESIVTEGTKGAGIGALAGGVLGAGGAALARPAALARAAEAEATRMRPLPVQDLNPETVYHGTSAEFDKIKGNEDGITYVASDSAEARAFADDPILGGGNGKRPRVIELAATPGKSKNVTDDVTSYVFEEDPNIDYSAMTLDDVIREQADRARSEGYRYIEFEHPSSVNADGMFTAKVSLYPEEDLANAGLNIRRFRDLPVEDANVRPGATRSNARPVPVNRVPEPYVPESELPVIKAGAPAKSTLPVIEAGRPVSRAKSDVSYDTPRPISIQGPEVALKATQVAPRVAETTVARLPRATSANVPKSPKASPRVDITTSPGRPVTMDIPRKTATVEVKLPKEGQAVTVSKPALEANRKLVQEGYEAIPESELAKIGSINKADQIDRVSRLMDDPRVKDMAAGTVPVPDGVAPQVLFNAVKNRAVKEGDFETLRRLASSPIAEERSTAAQTLGSAGFNNEPADAVEAMRAISKEREKVATRRRQPSDVKKEVAAAKASIRKVTAKETWNSVVDALTC